MIDRPNWSTSTEQPGTALVPAASQEPPPTFTADDLALVDAPAEPDAVAIDEEDAAKYRKLLADGIFTKEELAEHYGLGDAELEALQGPPRPGLRQKIDAEIAEIEKRLRQDRRGYDKDLKAQARYLDLLRQREQLPATTGEAREWGDGSGLPPELLEQWQRQGQGTVDRNLKALQATVGSMLDSLEPEDGDALQNSFDTLPQGAQAAVYSFLALDGGHGRPATEAAVKSFSKTAEGSALISEWGDKAARNVGRVKAQMGMILGAMTPEDRSRAEAWFNDELSSSQAKAVLKALAGG